MEAPPSALDLVTLGLAIAGIVLSVVALTWQVVSWRLTGSVVRAASARGFYVMQDGSVGPNVVSVEARNIGRTAVEVRGWGFELPGGDTVVSTVSAPWAGPAVPYTLDGGHAGTWYMEEVDLRERLRAAGRLGEELRGYVSLSTGKKAFSRPFSLS